MIKIPIANTLGCGTIYNMAEYIDAHCHYVPHGDITLVAGFMYNSARPSDWRHAIVHWCTSLMKNRL